MTDHFQQIYTSRAQDYDRLVSREDYQGNILRALRDIHPIHDAMIVEMGAGTGRITRLVTPLAGFVLALDSSAHMLRTAANTLPTTENWALAVGDNSTLPIRDGVADLVLAGWSFGHATGWYPDRWRDEIGRAVDEMLRVLKPGGFAVIFETLGTGSTQPAPPSPVLAEYYRWLENELGFQHRWIRTDYQFSSIEEADELTRFFFGDSLADRVTTEKLTVLPECTGMWRITRS